jgi:hypothetical protein
MYGAVRRGELPLAFFLFIFTPLPLIHTHTYTHTQQKTVPTLGGDEKAAVFGVFDGHGGREVAHFVARHLVEELVRQGEYQEGSYEEALRLVCVCVCVCVYSIIIALLPSLTYSLTHSHTHTHIQASLPPDG